MFQAVETYLQGACLNFNVDIRIVKEHLILARIQVQTYKMFKLIATARQENVDGRTYNHL